MTTSSGGCRRGRRTGGERVGERRGPLVDSQSWDLTMVPARSCDLGCTDVRNPGSISARDAGDGRGTSCPRDLSTRRQMGDGHPNAVSQVPTTSLKWGKLWIRGS